MPKSPAIHSIRELTALQFRPNWFASLREGR
jgi:hypothetical protein